MVSVSVPPALTVASSVPRNTVEASAEPVVVSVGAVVTGEGPAGEPFVVKTTRATDAWFSSTAV